MSEIEIPKDVKEAWQHANYWKEKGISQGTLGGKLAVEIADALVWALAGWMRSEFEREHRVEHDFSNNYDYCSKCSDPCAWIVHHAWTDDQWLAAARVRLEER